MDILIQDLRKRRTKPLEQVFWERVAKRASGCWEWAGQLNKDGYGRLDIGEHKMVMAHRYSYQLALAQCILKEVAYTIFRFRII